jgi:hypothetical protein
MPRRLLLPPRKGSYVSVKRLLECRSFFYRLLQIYSEQPDAKVGRGGKG